MSSHESDAAIRAVGTESETSLPFDDDRVGALFDRLGWRIASAEAITSLRLPGSRRFAYRVTLRDGRTVKVRRLNHADRGARAIEILRTLADRRFAAPLLVEDDLVIEQWVDGVPLAVHPPGREHVERAAALLAALHRAEVGADIHGSAAAHTESPSSIADATLARLRLLGGAGGVSADTADRLGAIVRRLLPKAARIGITHNDFCGDNIVVDATGGLRVVDNEGVAVGFLDYDLARTWYRWELDGPLWEAFLASYGAAGGPPPDAAATEFWRVAAIAKSAAVRMRGTRRHLEGALVMLRRVSR